MDRKVKTKVVGFRTMDGAGVHLVRVLGNRITEEFHPILMLDSFDRVNQMITQQDFLCIHIGELKL